MVTAGGALLDRTTQRPVVATLRFEPTITEGGVDVSPPGCGITTTRVHVSGIRWVDTGAVVRIEGGLVVHARWAIDGGGRTDVPGPDATVVGPATWQEIVADLEPGPAGIPRRLRYWASDLSARHELFHADEDLDAARHGLRAAHDWLRRQSVDPSDRGVLDLLTGVQRLVKDAIEANYRRGGEERAFAAGRSLYQARADAVRARARTEGWWEASRLRRP